MSIEREASFDDFAEETGLNLGLLSPCLRGFIGGLLEDFMLKIFFVKVFPNGIDFVIKFLVLVKKCNKSKNGVNYGRNEVYPGRFWQGFTPTL